MIYTVTLNPSIDYIVGVSNFELGKTNRTTFEEKFPGGKGINVSRILNELETKSIALGFVGGFTGSYIINTLNEYAIQTDFIKVKNETRINIKLKNEVETEINGQGPKVTDDEINQLISRLATLSEQDTVIFSGSKPPALADNFYKDLVKITVEQGADFIIDTHATELLNVLSYRPLLIKPNKEELEELFAITIHSSSEVIPYGKKLVEMGARHVIISLGGDGAYLFTEKATYYGEAPGGKVVNSVGAGDSMIAGFTDQYSATKNVVEAFKLGLASGSATAFREDLATRNDIDNLLPKIQIHKI